MDPSSPHPLWRPFSPGANAARQAERIAVRQTPPGAPQEHSPSWAGEYATVAELVRGALGDRVLSLRHVGSTAVPGLVAKPVIDVDLEVPDAEDEPSYVPLLERVGFLLIFRDALHGDPHRQLTLAAPNTNLHVWSRGAIEPQRHLLFVERLIADADDRRRYAAAKLDAARDAGSARYNDLKAAAVYDIYESAFTADPGYPHSPRPRVGGG